MSDIRLGNRNPITGRFNFDWSDDGDVAFDESEAHAVITAAVEHRSSWIFNPRHGSELHTLRSLAERTPSQAEAMVLDAEEPLVQAREIDELAVTATPKRRDARLDVRIEWSTPTGGQRREDLVI